ncbi:hypothetical protein BSKO_03088 [Bryopsis sp. KO-2023]|nr:hypothetical protein BSKO_03088 [Bryopsis sp. KO-2023]
MRIYGACVCKTDGLPLYSALQEFRRKTVWKRDKQYPLSTDITPVGAIVSSSNSFDSTLQTFSFLPDIYLVTMKSAMFAVACLLLAGPAFAGRALMSGGIAGTSCNTFASVSFILKHGSCEAFASANCDAQAITQTKIESAVNTIFTTDLCSPAVVTAQSEAIAKAFASVYADSLTAAKCTANSQGFGCAFSVSKGDAHAVSLASAFAKAVAAAFGPDTSAICTADIEAIAVGLAEASAFALGQSCIAGDGSSVSFQSRFVSGTSILIAKAFALASAEVCENADLAASSKCKALVTGSSKSQDSTTNNPFGFTGSTGSGTSSGTNSGSSNAEKKKFCEDLDTFSCCFDNSTCAAKGLVVLGSVGPATVVRKTVGPVTKECFCH